MSHKYECGNCGHKFTAGDEYESTPQKRNCPACRKAKGNILYHGSGKSDLGLVSDDLGTKGILNPVDGKKYDSKSAYHRKLKDTGHHVYESTPNEKKLLNQGDHNVTKELKEAAQRAGIL